MNNDELIAAGHELAKCIDSNTPLLDIAKMIVRLADKLDVTTLALREKTKQCDELALKLDYVVMVRDAIAGVAEERREFIVNGVEMNFISLPKDGDADKATAVYSRCLLKPKFSCDAFLREVRAQVWIKGSEPPEFGRYWVRYETDVGPQYCSAQWMEYNFCASSGTNIHKIWLADHSRSISSLKGVTHYTRLPEPMEGGAK